MTQINNYLVYICYPTEHKQNDMKLIAVMLIALMGIQGVIAQEGSLHQCAKHKIQNLAAQKSGGKSLTDQDKYDINYIKLDIELDNLSTTIDRGHAEFKATVSAFTLDIFVLELASVLTVDSAKINGLIAPTNRVGDELQIFPANNLSQGASLNVEVYYHGDPPNGGGFFGGIFNDQSPSWGADVTWTLSQPFSAHTWWPCKQVLTDKIDSSEVWLTVPNGLKGGSNGLLQQEVSLPGNKTRFEWKHNHPIAYYLVSLAVGPYIDYNFMAPLPGTTDSVFIQNFVYDNPNTLTNFESDIELTADMMYVFSDLFGLYPYRNEKYGHCMAPLSGGMEHQTMTTQGFFETGLTAHELGHQWFGDNVTCADWGHIWVNEGFASYSEYLFYQSLNQNQAQNRMAGVHANVMSQGNGSVYVPINDQDDEGRIFSSRLTYDKGSTLVHMIRHWVNDDALFFQAMKSYQNTFANSTATAEDFIATIENVSGVSMGDFLNHWYYGEGHPTYSGTYNNVDDKIVVELTQTTSRPNTTPFFKSAIEIEINFMDNSDTIIYVMNSYNGQAFVFDIDKEIYAVSVDPENWVLNEVGSFSKDENLEITGLHDLNDFNRLAKLYPNPSKNQFNIELKEDYVEMIILDNLGRKVMEKQLDGKTHKIQHELPSGVYSVYLSTRTQEAVQQLMVP